MIAKLVVAIFSVVAVVALAALVSLIPFLLAWNYLVPVFHWPYLDWLQAYAILWVAGSLLSGARSTVAPRSR